jgi:hypothetical protein
MSATATSFYQTGGTLRPDATSYVERQADRDLYEGLSRGEYCYVLSTHGSGVMLTKPPSAKSASSL